MKNYMKEQEKYIKAELEKGDNLEEVFEYHKQQILWMQHERFIHLIVTLFTIAALLLFIVLLFNSTNIGIFIIFLILAVLTLFYLSHYRFLENTIQSWYELSNKIYFKMKKTREMDN
jgi:hypothetical protein